MAEKRLSAQEVLERRKRAKEAGTYTGTSSAPEVRNAQDALERRNQAKEAGTYKPYEPKEVRSVNPVLTKEESATKMAQDKYGTYEEFAKKNKEKVPGAMSDELYDKMMRDLYNGMVHQETQAQQSGSGYYGLTNEGYQEYLENIQKNATEQNQKDWLEEQKRNLEALRGNQEVYEAVKAWNSARWNPLEYMQKNDAENVLEKYGFNKEAIKSLADTYRREENASFSQTMMEEADKTTDSGIAGKAVGHIRSIGANMASIFAVPQGWAHAINEKITGEYNPVDTNSFWYMSGDYRDRVRQNNTNDITGVEEYEEKGEDIPGYRKALGMAYQAGSSVADNLLTAGAFGEAGALAIMGAQAAQSTMKDTFERTGDNTKSALTGTAAGLIEAATEKVSFDHFWDMAKGTGKTITRNMLVNLLMQSGIEGTEEMTSEALNTVVDRWINQKDSNYELNVQSYVNQGYSEEQARDMAFNDVWEQMKEAGKVGAMAGGMSGGVAIGANKLGQYSSGANAVQKGQMEQIVAQAQTYNDKRVQRALEEYQEKPSDMKAGKLMYEMYTVDEIARNKAEKANKGNLLQRITKNQKEGQNSQPQSVSEETQSQNTEQKPQIDVEDAIKRMSEAQNAEELSDAMHEVEDNGTQEQIQEARSYYEMRGAQMVVEGKTTNEELAFTGMQLSEAKAYEAGSKNEAVAPDKLSLKGKIAYNEGQQLYIKELARKNIISNTEEVVGAKVTDNTGKELVIQDIVLEEREPSVRTSNGTVNLKDISFQNEAVGLLYNNASTLGSTKAAQVYIKNYPGNIMVNAYENMAQSIMKDGELGLDIDKVLKRRAGAVYWIGEAGVKEFHALGQEKAKESNRQLETVKRKGKGQLNDKRRGKAEEPLLKVLEQIAERTGLDIEVSDKEVSEVRGYFEESLSRIVLNADANMFETVFHELGEFTDSWNTEGMRKFQTALLDWYFETHDNDKMQNLIESVQNIYKQQEGSKTYREAANEIVNDAISGLFATETGAKEFAEWLGKNRIETETKTILQTIADFLKDLCETIRTYISGHNLSATTRTTMEVSEEHAKALRQQFLDAMDKAVENYRKAETHSKTEDKKRNSIKEASSETNGFGLLRYTEHEVNNFSNGRTFFAETKQDIEEFIKNHVHKKPYSRILCGKIDNRLAERIKVDTGINLLNYNVAITSEYENKHIDPEKEAKQGMVAMSPDMVALLPDIITNYDKVEYAGYNKQQQQVLRFEKNINGRKVAVEYVSKGRKTIDLQTMYGWENKKEKNSHQASHANAHDRTFKTDLDMSSSTDSIAQNQKNATRRSSLNGNVKIAEEYFGTTYKINEAGYLLTDGKFLDFSGRHEGAQGGHRTVDHRDIIDALGEDYGGDTYTGGMIRFMQEGNIRLSPESGGINLSVKPRKTQLDTLDRYITNFRGEVTLDIDDANGNTVVSMEYPTRTYSKRIINDIVNYFDKGIIPEQPSTLGQFRYSLDIETYLSSSEQGLFWNKIGERKNGTQFPKSRNGDSIITIGNKLVYTGRGYQNPKVNKIVEVIVTEDSEYEDTYTSFVQEDIINEYERKQKYASTSFEDFARVTRSFISDDFGREVIIREHKEEDSVANRKNGLAGKGQVRQRAYYNFEDEQERSGDSGESGAGSTLRYSLNDATDLSDFWFNNDNLEEPIGNAASILEEGAKLLQGKEVDTENIRRIARGMVKEYQSHYNVDTLSGNLEKLFSYMQTQDKVSYDDMVKIMTEITMPVIEESTSVDETQQEIYQNFKKKLRGMNIRLSQQQKDEVAHYYDSYENFRRKMFGTLSLSESGISLDELWLEISDMSQGFVDLDVTETDQPIRLVEALEQMKPQVVNNFGADNHGVAMDMALRIYEEYFKAQHSAKVRSLEIKMRRDRVEWQKQERQKYQDNLREIRKRIRDREETINERVAKVRAEYRTSELQRKYDQDAAEYRYKIKKTGNELVRWIEHPTHQKHVPQQLKGMVLEFLDCIDFVSHRAKEDSKTTLQWRAKMLAIQKELEVTNVHMEAGTAEDSQLKNFLQTLNPDFLPTLDKFLNDSERVEKISQMGYSQLKELEFLVRSMKTAVVKANELHANKLYRYAADAGTETLRELNKRTKRKAENKVVQLTGKALSLDMAEPKTYFERLGKGATSIYKEFRKGMDKRIFLIREARQYMEEILKDVNPEELKTWVGDKATVHIVQAKEGKIQLTTGQIMSLYLLSKRNQGRVHILQGGIRATEVGEGKNKIVQNKEVHLSQAQLAKILELLTPEQKALADKMQKFLADNCAKWGNEVHMQMYEYEMFNDERYFPIRTVEGQRNDKGKQDDTGNAYAVKNLGFTKNIQKKAPQAIWAEDIMEAFVNHTVNMATYNAYLIPLADAMKWFNFNNAGFEGEHFELDSVHGVIEEVYGKEANTYFKELLYEINGREKRDSKAELMKVLTRNMKKASVMGSLSVMVQQPTAYVRAINVLDAKDLLGALDSLTSVKKMKENAEEAIQYSAIAQWKDWGFYEAYMGKTMQQVITGQQSTWEKIEDVASAGARNADKYTWGVLWNACKKEITRTRKDMEVGSKEFFEAVTERFDEVIDETQVVDSILHKCPALKSDGIISMEMAFMNEPIKSYNMLCRAADHLAREESTGFKKMQKAFLNKKFGRATTAYLLSNLLTSMAASLVYALRDDKEEPFGQRYWNRLTDTALDNLNPLSMIPIAKSVISLLQGYEVERMDMQGISTVISAVQTAQKKITQPDKSTQTWYGVAKKFARGLSTLHGDPFYNVWRDAEAIFEEMAGMNVPEKETNGNLYEDLIWSEAGSKTYESAYKKLQKQKGKTDDDIKKGVRSKLNAMFKEGELTEDEAKDALRRFGYADVSDIVNRWKENMEK